jgi:hypothetical protein
MDVILKALQSIMRGGDDAEDSNIVVSLCEDDQEDSHSKANPASADGNRVPAEEKGDKKQSAFEVENVVMESEKEHEDGEEEIVGALKPTSSFYQSLIQKDPDHFYRPHHRHHRHHQQQKQHN